MFLKKKQNQNSEQLIEKKRKKHNQTKELKEKNNVNTNKNYQNESKCVKKDTTLVARSVKSLS